MVIFPESGYVDLIKKGSTRRSAKTSLVFIFAGNRLYECNGRRRHGTCA